MRKFKIVRNGIKENIIGEISIEENTIEKNTIEKNTIEKNTIEENTIEESTIEESTIEENTIEKNTIEESTIEENTMEENTIEVYGEEIRETVPVLYLLLSPGEGTEVYQRLKFPCVLVCVESKDWNRDFSPWAAERIFPSGEDFSGQGEAFLKWLLQEVLPEVESSLSFSVVTRGIAGYSLAGLFAVYAMYHCRAFDRIGCISGSLWYEGFVEYAMKEEISKGEDWILYLSLGSKEHKVRNQKMASVKQCTDTLADYWRQFGTVIYEENQGGHFDKVPERIARGLNKLLEYGSQTSGRAEQRQKESTKKRK